MTASMSDITSLLDAAGVPSVTGYAATKAALPYVVARPLTTLYGEMALNGSALSWDTQFALYCAAGSVEASHNLATDVVRILHGVRVGDSTLAASLGYVGAQVEGHYETQVTIQTDQGGI
ncbi:tail terminator [Microbacterium phage Sinatra]|uniref:Tail terminator n=1 Tax=Microbacterium phage Sinatra TaxID=2591219 RepID=A0A514DGJ7_9CAUD|nr:tail terminator [Microbacterium phage Sinatra]